MNKRNAQSPGSGILRTSARIGLGAILLLEANALAGQENTKQGKSKDKEFSVTVQGPETDAGLIVSARATAKEVGLPIYAGAVPHSDNHDDSPAAKLGLWGNSSGFKLVVLKMESKDSPKKVAEYYQKALAKYGSVLDCTNAAQNQHTKADKSERLSCGDDKPDKGGMLFKAGTKARQHIVAVQPDGTGSLFQLVYIESRSEQKEPA